MSFKAKEKSLRWLNMELETLKDKHEYLSDGIICRIKLLENAIKAIEEVVIDDIQEEINDNMNGEFYVFLEWDDPMAMYS